MMGPTRRWLAAQLRQVLREAVDDPFRTALALYFIYRILDELATHARRYSHEWRRLTEPPAPVPPSQPGERAQRSTSPSACEANRPGFTITNERGERRGSVGDASIDGWGWQVQDTPLISPQSGTSAQSGPSRSALRRTDSVDSTSGGAKRKVHFQLDRSVFNGFVYAYDTGVCIAHGADPTFVGLTLSQARYARDIRRDGASRTELAPSQVLDETCNTEVDGEELHGRFIAAAEGGGGWVSYEWRNAATASLHLKGAYVIKVSRWGRDFYAGVGYSVTAPPNNSPKNSPRSPDADGATDGLYGFVFSRDGVCRAHGASSQFVGRTLGQVTCCCGAAAAKPGIPQSRKVTSQVQVCQTNLEVWQDECIRTRHRKAPLRGGNASVAGRAPKML